MDTTTITADVAPAEEAARTSPARHRGERGMATVEYAIGIVLVVVIVGIIIVSFQTGTFNDLLRELVEAVFDYVGKAFGVAFPTGIKI